MSFCVFLFCFRHECPSACLPQQQTQLQQKFSIPIQTRSIIHNAIAVLWQKREKETGRDGGGERHQKGGKRRGVVVFPKKGCFRDRICMCTQWQHPLCFSHVSLLSLPLSSPCSIRFLSFSHLRILFLFSCSPRPPLSVCFIYRSPTRSSVSLPV